MVRLITLTAVGLCFLSMCLNLAFAERVDVKWGECLLSDQEVVIGLQNQGGAEWARYTLAVKVFAGDSLVATANLAGRTPLGSSAGTKHRLSLSKPLRKGEEYRVVAHLQSGRATIVSQHWSRLRPLKVTRLPMPNEPGWTAIPEVQKLRRPFKAIDVRKEIGLL